ncbi:MAG: hypothetical protein LBM74_01545 [Oscillospiraceae bacterium]|nr:hypothetical protein [Oscillospiraceae bacterium]
MPNIKRAYPLAMQKAGIPQSVIDQFDFSPAFHDRNPQERLAIIETMDTLLTQEQRMAVMEQQGCCKSGQRDKDCRAFAKAYGIKPLAEKVKLLSGVQWMMNPVLEGNTLTVTFGGHQNGVHQGKNTCSCGTIRHLRQPFTVSKTYCACCAGHFRYHYQNALGVKLRLKEIVSSPLDTHGEMPCSMRFEVMDVPNKEQQKGCDGQ